MLVSLVGRCGAEVEQEMDRYAAWSAALRRLRYDWGQGRRPHMRQLRDYLQEVPTDQQAEALQDLIAAHLTLTWQSGKGMPLESYLGEFGADFVALASAAAVPADLIEDEFLARYLWPHGDCPHLEEYQRRFPGRDDLTELLRQRCLDGGRYVKLRRRGRGGMAEVWEAYDHHLRRRVAIKEPDAWPAGDDMLRRFAEEARVTAGLEHPGIVGVHEYRDDGNSRPFYVMRLVNGPTLGERIRDYHELPDDRPPGEQRLLWNRLLHSFVTICDATAYAHAHGVLHRDLKPGNVVVSEFGETVILDWGMGRRLAPGEPAAGLVVGTPEYMPPEQADGLADVRSDVFGLGAILYELLAGQAPRPWTEGGRPTDWVDAVRHAHFPPPRRLKSETPRALEAICLKALARDPAERYPGAAELAQDVRRYLAGEPVTAWAEPLSARVRRWLGGRSL
jgi:hypothetical protein